MSARVLAGALSWLSLGNVGARALSLVTMPLLTQWLSPDAYGEAAMVGTVVSLLSMFALAGIDVGYARHYCSGAVGASEAVEAFCWRWTLFLSLIAAFVGATVWVVGFGRWFDMRPELYPFVATGIFASALATMAQTRARLQIRYRQISLTQVSAGVLTASMSLTAAYFWRADSFALLIAMVGGYLLSGLMLGLPSAETLLRTSGLSIERRKALVAVGVPALVTAPAYWVVSSSDRWFLARYFDSAEVGIYSLGSMVGTVGVVVSSAITAAWLPELARAESEERRASANESGERVQLLLCLSVVVWVATVAAGGDVLRWLASPKFHAAAAVVPMLAAGVLFYGLMHVGNAFLVMRGQMRWTAAVWCVALTASLVLNAWLVPELGSHGAALTQVISFLIAMILVWVAVLKFESLDLKWSRIALATVLALAAGFLLERPWSESPLVSLGIKLPAGLCLAVALSVLLVPRLCEQTIRRLGL